MRWADLTAFAVRDLTSATAARGTLVLTVAVACGVLFAEVGFAVVYGVERAEYGKLTRDPLALCVWAGGDPNTAGLTAGEVARLRRQLAERAGGRQRGLHPVRVFDLNFTRQNGRQVESLGGRTLAVGDDPDPLPSSRPVRDGGRWFDGPDDEGVVASRTLLERLGFSPASPPSHLEVEVSGTGGEFERLPLRGVFDDDLPVPGQHFLLTEARAEQLLYPARTNPATSSAESGPIPPHWLSHPQRGGMREEFRQAVETAFPRDPPKDDPNGPRFDAELERKGTHFVVSVTVYAPAETPKATLRKARWQERFGAVARQMKGDDRAEFTRFTQPEPANAGGAPPATQDLRFGLLAVYATDVRSLVRVADELQTLPLSDGTTLRVDRGVVDQVSRVGQLADQYEAAMSWGVAVLSGVFALLVGFVFWVRAEQRVAELGMLKAMGFRRLGAFSALQGAMVGLTGGLVGSGVAAVLIGLLAERLYTPDARAVADATYREPGLFALATLAATFGSAVVAWLATWKARRATPAAALRTAV